MKTVAAAGPGRWSSRQAQNVRDGMTFKQTLVGRRKRFRAALLERLGEGWEEDGAWVSCEYPAVK